MKSVGERTLLGFDFGTRSIGVAIGQEITGSAQPLRALKANDGIPSWEEIGKLLGEWQRYARELSRRVGLDACTESTD